MAKNRSKQFGQTNLWRVFSAGVGTSHLLIGVIFYASMRPPQLWIAWAPRLPKMNLPEPVASAMPCFVHVVAFACLTAAVTTKPRCAIVFCTALAMVWEGLQGLYPVLGTFDPLDLIACLIGAAFIWLIIGVSVPKKVHTYIWFKILIMRVGASALMPFQVPEDANGAL